MGSITDFLEAELLDHICNAAYTPSATIFVALATADPTDAATGASMSEVANANGYVRTAITFAAAASRAVDQSGSVTFPAASGGGWGTVTHWAIVTSATYGAGDALAHGAFTASKLINDGDTPSIATSEIDVTISAGEVSNYLANIVLDFAFRNQAFSAPATHIAFATAVLTDASTGASMTEVANSGAYARQQVAINGGSSPTWDLASATTPTLVDNTHAITFPTATGNWGTITSWVVVDGGTHGAGNVLFYDNDVADKAVNTDDTAEFAIGELNLTAA